MKTSSYKANEVNIKGQSLKQCTRSAYTCSSCFKEFFKSSTEHLIVSLGSIPKVLIANLGNSPYFIHNLQIGVLRSFLHRWSTCLVLFFEYSTKFLRNATLLVLSSSRSHTALSLPSRPSFPGTHPKVKPWRLLRYLRMLRQLSTNNRCN